MFCPATPFVKVYLDKDWGMIPYESQNEEKGLEKYSLTLSLRRILIDTSNRVFNSAKNF